MAVQAQQHPGNASALFFPAGLRQVSDHQPLTFHQRLSLHGGAAIFSGEQGSELTCNISASRKRSREELNLLQQQQLWLSGKSTPEKRPPSIVSLENNSRLIDSSMSSTSGRSGTSPAISSPAGNPLSQELLSQFYQQNHEVDALIRLENDRLRTVLEEARKRHCRALIMAMEEALIRKLKEKEVELENAARRNRELEEKIWQMTAENQMWFSIAKNNEALVSTLRLSLEQAIQNSGGEVAAGPPDCGEEGFGDSDCVAAEDALSCCNLPENNNERSAKRTCKVCGENEVSVLLLPCRHLCLCKQCEARLDACPLCSATKNASLQIFMS